MQTRQAQDNGVREETDHFLVQTPAPSSSAVFPGAVSLEVGAFIFFEGLNACFFVMNELISCRVDGMWGLVEPNAEDVTSRCEINIETSVGAKHVGRSEVDVLTGDGDFLKLSKVITEAFGELCHFSNVACNGGGC